MLVKIPIKRQNTTETVCFYRNGERVGKIQAKLADKGMDCWEYIILPGECGPLDVREDENRQGAKGIQFLEESRLAEAFWEKNRPQFHLTPECGKFERICNLSREKGSWSLILSHDMLSGDTNPVFRRCVSRDLLHWNMNMGFLDEEVVEEGNVKVFRQSFGFENWGGGVEYVCWFSCEGKIYETAFCRELCGKSFLNLMSLPFERIQDRLYPIPETANLRLWERRWKEAGLRTEFVEELRFRMIPGKWPDIQIVKPNYTKEDIDGELFEVLVDIRANGAEEIRLELCKRGLVWERKRGRLSCESGQIDLCKNKERLKLHIWADHGVMEILAEGKVLLDVWEEREPEKERPREGIAENIDFRIGKIEKQFLKAEDKSGSAVLEEVIVYGLRGIHRKKESCLAISAMQEGKICYESDSFRIYENRVEDKRYGEPPAYVTGRETIVSPSRVVEEFQWREGGFGDMSRQICRHELYKIQAPPERFPVLETGLEILDIAYKIAGDVFYLCGSREYALPGQEDMWSAGLFQGKGEGFGVWLRDSVHTALRCGSLIDRDMAHSTLKYAVGQGFDNGADGPAMPAVGVWDYYCATGDISLVYETWEVLLEKIQEAEKRYDTEKGLVRAGQSTSNDAFLEPEAGGYCLGAEIYYMDAFLSMEKMGRLLGENNSLIEKWGRIGRKIRKNIRTLYWKESAGFFTSGPVGSQSYEEGIWETSGMEGALWSRFGIANERQKRSSLMRLEDIAMTEFGIDLFPCRKEKNHFCHASWGVWNAGFASAACDTENGELIWRLLMQQVRNAVMNKTFYEVVDVSDGRAWRWPGQLWHAAGFVSCIYYGLLGIRYDETGMRIKPVKQEYLKTIKLTGLRYGNGVYDMEIQGNGTCLYLDDQPAEIISQSLAGHHRLEYK